MNQENQGSTAATAGKQGDYALQILPGASLDSEPERHISKLCSAKPRGRP